MTLASILLFSLMAVPVASLAQTPEFVQGRSMAATCVGCHGGKAAQVSLAGVSRDELLQKLKAFKAGTRPATVMHQISRGYSEAQLVAVATYFSAQKK